MIPQPVLNLPTSPVPVEATQDAVMMAIPYGSPEGSTVYQLIPSYLMQYPLCNAYLLNANSNGTPQVNMSAAYPPRPVLVASQPSVALAIQPQSPIPIQPHPQPQVPIQPLPQSQVSLVKPLQPPFPIQSPSQSQTVPKTTQESKKPEDSNSVTRDETVIRCSCGRTHCLKL